MKRVLVALAAIIVLGGVVFCALAWRPGIAEVEAPAPDSFDTAQVALGGQLAAAGNCHACHTVDGGADFAGGLPVVSDFGTIYSTNITPDPETGIGAWSEEAFHRAMRKGVRRDGAHLFPAFPYDHFTKLTDADIGALYAYLMTVEPASYEAPEAELPAPLGWRALQGGWKLLFFRGGVYEPESDHDEQWNRGAYLAEGIGHCSSCHTPRNALGAEKGGGDKYSGAEVGGFYAPAINSEQTAGVPWTATEMYAFLRTGGSPLHGIAAGEMSEVVHVGLGALPDEDIEAMAVYFAELAGAPEDVDPSALPSLLNRPSGPDMAAAEVRGGQLFGSFCVSCHFTAPDAPMANRPALAINSAVLGPDPANFVHVVLHGVSLEEGNPDASMPGFDRILSDQDIADMAAYLRAAYADEAGEWQDLVDLAAETRVEGAE